MSFAKVILMGHLTRDPEVKFLQSGSAVVNFDVAVNHKYKNAQDELIEKVAFISVAGFGKRAEVIGEHFHKGDPILVDGRLDMEEWDDKQTGARRTKLKVVMENFEFVGGKKDGGGGESRQSGNGGGRQAARSAGRSPAPVNRGRQAPPPAERYEDDPDNSIPF